MLKFLLLHLYEPRCHLQFLKVETGKDRRRLEETIREIASIVDDPVNAECVSIQVMDARAVSN